MAGCSDGGSKETEEEESGKKTKSSTEESMREPEPSKDGEGENTKDPQSISEELYKGFLAGNIRVHCDNLDFFYYVLENGDQVEYDLFTYIGGYTLKEFVKEIQGAFELETDADIRVSDVSWTLLDCGDDGDPELGLKIISESTIWGSHEDTFVIKNIDGKLQICYGALSSYMYPCYEHLQNHYGLITEFHYGDSYDSATYGWLDENADYHFLYSVSNNDSAESIYGNTFWIPSYECWLSEDEWISNVGLSYDHGVISDVVPIYDEWGMISDSEIIPLFDLNDFFVRKYRLKEYEEGEDESQVYRYSYEYHGGDEYGDASDVMRRFEEVFLSAGVKFYAEDENEEFLNQRIKECGLSDKIIAEYDENFRWNQLEKTAFWPGEVTP